MVGAAGVEAGPTGSAAGLESAASTWVPEAEATVETSEGDAPSGTASVGVREAGFAVGTSEGDAPRGAASGRTPEGEASGGGPEL